MDLSKLEASLQVSFKNKSLLQQAFTHISYTNEQKAQGKFFPSNERLEFLGDAVLQLAVSDYLYHHFSKESEGVLSRIRIQVVCEPFLAAVGKDLGFGNYIKLSRGEIITEGHKKPSILSDTVEAFIGALFLDQGLESVSRFLHQFVFTRIDDELLSKIIDDKSRLLEYVSKKDLGTIDFRLIKAKGPDHDRHFMVKAYLEDQFIGKGSGATIKEAQQKAAREALGRLQKE